MKMAGGTSRSNCSDLLDEVQRERGVLPAGPHDGGVLVLLEAPAGDLDALLYLVLERRVVL